MTATDWNPVLRGEFEKPYWPELRSFVAAERAAATVYPPVEQEFAALHLTPYADTRVLILGQDPYHGPGQAHGLCFSVQPGVKPPPSLENIFKEMETDVGCPRPSHGNLEAWARQGVLLLGEARVMLEIVYGSHVSGSPRAGQCPGIPDSPVRDVRRNRDRAARRCRARAGRSSGRWP